MGDGTNYPADTSIFSKTELFLTHSVFKANDIEVPISSSATSFNTNQNCYIFANNNKGNVQYQSTFRLYGAKIYTNGSLVRDYIPAKDENNVVCLYDDVSKTFFYNSGTEDFIAGIEIPNFNDNMDSNTVLLIHGDKLLDSSIYKVPIENTGVTNVTTKTNLSDKSLYFNGSSYLKIDMSNLDFNFNSDWTIEWWDYYINNSNKSATVCIPDGSSGLLLGTPINNEVRIYAKDLINPSAIGTYNNSKFVHRAVCRKGNTISAFENGVKTFSIAVEGAYNHDKVLYLGYRGHPDHAGYFKGYMDEIRISNIAIWTENFVPPTKPYNPTQGFLNMFVKYNNNWVKIN